MNIEFRILKIEKFSYQNEKKEEISPLCIKKEKSLLREKNERKKIENFKNKSRTITMKKEIKIRASSKKNKTKKFANQQIKVRAFKVRVF